MDQLSRNGHRKRVKESYLKNSFLSMPDSNVLELMLFYAIPQKDVKQIAYDLLNRFGTLEAVLTADVQELQRIHGISEHSAILLKLFNDVHMRMNQNRAGEKLNSFACIASYASMMLSGYSTEKVLLICLNSNNEIIVSNIIGDGDPGSVHVSKRMVCEIALSNKACGVVLAHNHPGGSSKPSSADISLTQELGVFLRQMDVNLVDHVIVGGNGETTSLKDDMKYIGYFD